MPPKKHDIYTRIGPYLYCTPTFLVMLVFMISMFLLNIAISFTNYSFLKPVTRFVGLQNYAAVFSGDTLRQAVEKSFVWTAGSVVLSMILGIFFAVVMGFRIKGNSILKAIILLPWILPESITAYVWKMMFSSGFGILHSAMVGMGLVSPEAAFFTDARASMMLVILANVWRSSPFVAIMVYAKIQSLPDNYVEAAMIDGANPLQVFVHITVAWSMPIIRRCAALLFIWAFNAFTIIYTMTYGGPGGATSTLPFTIRQVAFKHYNFGQAATLGVVTLLIIGTCALVARLAGLAVKKIRAAGGGSTL